MRGMIMAAVLTVGLLLGGTASAGEAASDFTLRDIDGNAVTLSDLKGKVVIVSFWATWCGPCKEEMPHLQKMLTEKRADGLEVLSISTDDARSASRVKPFVKKMGYDFTVLLDRDSTVIGTYNPNKTLPYTVVVDREGQVVRRHSGYNPGDEVELKEFVDGILGGKAVEPVAPEEPAAEG